MVSWGKRYDVDIGRNVTWMFKIFLLFSLPSDSQKALGREGAFLFNLFLSLKFSRCPTDNLAKLWIIFWKHSLLLLSWILPLTSAAACCFFSIAVFLDVAGLVLFFTWFSAPLSYRDFFVSQDPSLSSSAWSSGSSGTLETWRCRWMNFSPNEIHGLFICSTKPFSLN